MSGRMTSKRRDRETRALSLVATAFGNTCKAMAASKYSSNESMKGWIP